jgi:hypothetical protein
MRQSNFKIIILSLSILSYQLLINITYYLFRLKDFYFPKPPNLTFILFSYRTPLDFPIFIIESLAKVRPFLISIFFIAIPRSDRSMFLTFLWLLTVVVVDYMFFSNVSDGFLGYQNLILFPVTYLLYKYFFNKLNLFSDKVK